MDYFPTADCGQPPQKTVFQSGDHKSPPAAHKAVPVPVKALQYPRKLTAGQ